MTWSKTMTVYKPDSGYIMRKHGTPYSMICSKSIMSHLLGMTNLVLKNKNSPSTHTTDGHTSSQYSEVLPIAKSVKIQKWYTACRDGAVVRVHQLSLEHEVKVDFEKNSPLLSVVPITKDKSRR